MPGMPRIGSRTLGIWPWWLVYVTHIFSQQWKKKRMRSMHVKSVSLLCDVENACRQVLQVQGR